MKGKEYLTFPEYLNINGFHIGVKEDNGYDREDSLTEEMVIKQLEPLLNFHEKARGYAKSMGKPLENNIGKFIEDCKVDVKRVKRYLFEISKKERENHLEDYILDNGEVIIRRAEKSLEHIYHWNYIDIIYRAMRRREICLGDMSLNNLIKSQGITINNIKYANENMVECDLIFYLSKIKRKGYDFNWQHIISEFCKIENLNEDSEEFIKAMISYPYEFMKCINRYRENKKQWTIEEYLKKLKSAIDKDGKSLL